MESRSCILQLVVIFSRDVEGVGTDLLLDNQACQNSRRVHLALALPNMQGRVSPATVRLELQQD